VGVKLGNEASFKEINYSRACGLHAFLENSINSKKMKRVCCVVIRCDNTIRLVHLILASSV